jgi:hypothetical protein
MSVTGENLWDVPQFISLYRQEMNINFHHTGTTFFIEIELFECYDLLYFL